MGTINKQRLSTGDNRNFSSGFPMFPANTTIDSPRTPLAIGVGSGPRSSRNLLDTRVPLAWFAFNISISQQAIAGAFFGFQMGYDVEGVTRNNGTASLTFSNEFAQGGIGFGLGITWAFNVRIDESILEFTFQDGITGTWRTLLNFTTSVTVDVIEIALLVLSRLLNVPALSKLTELSSIAGTGAIWGLFATNATQGLSSGSTLGIRPRLNLSANILEKIPKVAEFIKGAKKVGVKISLGPTFIIAFPVTINIVRLTTEDGSYNVTGASSGTFNFSGGPVGSLGPTVNSLAIVHSHSMGLEWGIELRASFSFLKLLSISGAIRVPLNFGGDLGRTNFNVGPFFTALTSAQNSAMQEELPEVVWG
jgi:hypothetical protein